MAHEARTPPTDPDEFLREFQSLLRYSPLHVDWIARTDRFDELADLGLTQNQATEAIRDGLQSCHLHRGAEPDDHEPENGIVCTYRYPVPGVADAYVKIGLRITRNRTGDLRGVIWSFKRWSPRAGQ